MGRRAALATFATGLAAAVLLCVPGAALAHATLEGTQPAQGTTVARNPGQVVFEFNETVEGNFGAVRVFDTRGGRADVGDGFHPNGTGALIGVHLKPGLADGTYTATYRVVSADGHIVTGGFVFSIGKPGASSGLTVAQLLGRNGTGGVTTVAFAEARSVQYGAIAVGLGGLVFLLGIWLPALGLQADGSEAWREASEAFVSRLRVTLLMCALLGGLSAVAGVVLEAAEAAGISGWSALAPDVLREELGTRFGTIWAAGAACWLAVGVLSAGLLRPSSRRAPVLRPVSLGSTGLALGRDRRLAAGLGVPLAALLLLPALSGHGATQTPLVVMFPSITAHVAAISVWLGGLVVLLAVLPAATRCLERTERVRLLAGVVGRFSGFALVAVIVLLASGLVQSYVEVRQLDRLVSTDFGRAVLIKFVVLMALIGLGAVNRRRTLPRLRALAERGEAAGATGWSLRRTLRVELALIVVALGATGALASYAPAAAQYAGPYNATTTVGGKELQLTLDPAKVGSNELHLYLFDPQTGAQYDGAEQVTVGETLPSKGIGPLTQTAEKAGPGHYTVPGILLGVPGTWKLEITVLIDKFDEYSRTVSVPVQ